MAAILSVSSSPNASSLSKLPTSNFSSPKRTHQLKLNHGVGTKVVISPPTWVIMREKGRAGFHRTQRSMEMAASCHFLPFSTLISPSSSTSRAASSFPCRGSHPSLNNRRRQCFSCLAVVSGSTTVPDDSLKEHTASTKQFDLNTRHEEPDATESFDGSKMIRVCDKLIDVFMVDKPTPTDWRRLLAFSKEWDNIRPHFYKRCQDRADNESDSGMKHKLLRLRRKLKEIDDDVVRHNELLYVIRNAPSEMSEIVSRRRKDFTKEFFVHLHTVAESYYDDPAEQDAIAKLGNMCLAAVQTYDTATESIEALNAAELKFQDIINSPSLDVACRKIDSLAEKNQLDSALVLMITKAWSAAKDSNMMKDEVKDILYHLYMTSRGNLQRLMPKEIRILKYVLTINDPEERLGALRDAFTPGEELEGKDVDCLYTTPVELHTWIKTVVDAYHFSREGTLLKEARDLMNPRMIQKLEEIKKIVEDKFM